MRQQQPNDALRRILDGLEDLVGTLSEPNILARGDTEPALWRPGHRDPVIPEKQIEDRDASIGMERRIEPRLDAGESSPKTLSENVQR